MKALLTALGLLALVVAAATLRPSSEGTDFATWRAAWQPSHAYLLDRNGEVLDAERVDFEELRLAWTPLGDVSPIFISTLLAIEDQRFHQHHGVDWRALCAAAWRTLFFTGRRGASTVSMQLASLEERGPQGRRGLLDKWRQIRAALHLETRATKAEILEAYVNEIPYRGELRGIAAASASLFGKQPAGLTGDESLLLATLVSSPNLAPAALARRACMLGRAHGLAHDCARVEALALAHLAGKRTLPIMANAAPALAHRLLKRAGQRVRTTLDARLQVAVNAMLREQLQRLDLRNVRDASAVVLDNASGAVLAWVGAAGPHSTAPAIDGVVAPRQAGSTLKPFLYGLALEKRYLTPASVLEDSPLNLETATGLYIPQNYDRDFKGLVSARTALASSLNVPAVRTLVMTGVEAFRARLFDLGYRGISRDGEYYGYSLALGSAEVSLLEQADAYRALANGGRFSDSHVEAAAPAAQFQPVMAKEAAFLIGEILADPAARALTFGLDSPLALPFWSAVKTGTSKDMRDNWCVGYSTRYTVAVWVGNFEGDAMADVSGITGAAPAWAAIMRALHGGEPPLPPVPPAGVVRRSVEFADGLEAPREDWFVAGTEMAEVRLLGDAGQRPRIASPANGVVIALDPDIPHERQQVTLASRGADPATAFYLDGQALGPATDTLSWPPAPGYHQLEMRSGNDVLDTVRFTVRMPH